MLAAYASSSPRSCSPPIATYLTAASPSPLRRLLSPDHLSSRRPPLRPHPLTPAQRLTRKTQASKVHRREISPMVQRAMMLFAAV